MPIRPALQTNDPISTWANSVQDNINQNQLAHSNDFVLKNNGAGSFLILSNKYKYKSNYLNYAQEYNPNKAYNPGDIIRVLPGRDYLGAKYLNNHSLQSLAIQYTPPIPTTFRTSQSLYSGYCIDSCKVWNYS